MKKILTQYLETMTYVFAMLVLLQAILTSLLSEDKMISSLDLLGLAALVLMMTTIAHFVSYLKLNTAIQFHSVNIGLQLLAFFILEVVLSPGPVNFEHIITNIIIFLSLYFSVYKIQQNKMAYLAAEINRKLANRA